MLDESSILLSNSFDALIREFKGTEYALHVGIGFLGGDWLEVLSSLRKSNSKWFAKWRCESTGFDIVVTTGRASRCSHTNSALFER